MNVSSPRTPRRNEVLAARARPEPDAPPASSSDSHAQHNTPSSVSQHDSQNLSREALSIMLEMEEQRIASELKESEESFIQGLHGIAQGAAEKNYLVKQVQLLQSARDAGTYRSEHSEYSARWKQG
jgi:hypothetical protein